MREPDITNTARPLESHGATHEGMAVTDELVTRPGDTRERVPPYVAATGDTREQVTESLDVLSDFAGWDAAGDAAWAIINEWERGGDF